MPVNINSPLTTRNGTKRLPAANKENIKKFPRSNSEEFNITYRINEPESQYKAQLSSTLLLNMSESNDNLNMSLTETDTYKPDGQSDNSNNTINDSIIELNLNVSYYNH